MTISGNKAETVILIHGLWMHGIVFLPHQRWLQAEGYSVRRFSYPSWRGGLAGNAELLSGFVKDTPGAVIHLVAHSLGGLVALEMLSRYPDARIRSLVMMGTPYAGCHSGITLAALPVLNVLVGRTLKDWFGQPRPALQSAVGIGVLAGTRPIGLGRLIPGIARPNDGVVAVNETHVAEARDSIALNISHSGMLVSRVCARQIANFLRTGKFFHA
jgi:pimeloyl-ACP methyl ester carboxylesterase